jgi:hypothetical protein
MEGKAVGHRMQPDPVAPDPGETLSKLNQKRRTRLPDVIIVRYDLLLGEGGSYENA